MSNAKLAHDPLQTLLEVFNDLYPEHPGVTVWFREALAVEAGGWGCTRTHEDGTAEVLLDPVLPFASLTETLGHELAHAAVSQPEHGPPWQEAYGHLRTEYEWRLTRIREQHGIPAVGEFQHDDAEQAELLAAQDEADGLNVRPWPKAPPDEEYESVHPGRYRVLLAKERRCERYDVSVSMLCGVVLVAAVGAAVARLLGWW